MDGLERTDLQQDLFVYEAIDGSVNTPRPIDNDDLPGVACSRRLNMAARNRARRPILPTIDTFKQR
jgi:hypothetical protein